MAEVLQRNFEDNGKIPEGALKLVLSHLPLQYLLTTAATVCRHWSKVILDPAFLPWKKLYHQLKAAPDSLISPLLLDTGQIEERLPVKDVVHSLSVRYAITDLPSAFVKIIKMMGSTHRTPRNDPTVRVLQQHPLHHTAMATLTHLDSSLLSPPYNTWHIVTTIVLLCADMWQVDTVFHLVFHPTSLYTCYDAVEAFYCLATFLLYCSRKFHLPSRYHYIVYYALYLHENSWASVPPVDPGVVRHPHSGQQSITRFIKRSPDVCLTHEQMRIINHNIQENHVVKIVAFAGTGKTKTLLHFCRQRPHLKFLLMVFNKSVQEHAQQCFPPCTTVRTAHSLAHRKYGYRFAKISQLEQNLKANMIVSFLDKRETSNPGNRLRRAALVITTLECFLSSVDDIITLSHVPATDKQGDDLVHYYREEVLLEDAVAVWGEMNLCKANQRIPMTQDGVLKLWQVSHPKLDQYNIIMVDEAQDMNAAMFDVILRQPCAKVIVGDPYQQIYSFRGAVNALSQVPATHTFYLTQSFRFGPEIGYAAHCVLESKLNVKYHTLVGGRCQDSIMATPDPHKFPVYQEEARQLLSQDNYIKGQQSQEGTSSQQSLGTRGQQSLTGTTGQQSEAGTSVQQLQANTFSHGRFQKKLNSKESNQNQIVKRAFLARTNLELYKVALAICKDDSFMNASKAFAGGVDSYKFDTVLDIYKLNEVAQGFGTAETLGIKTKFIARFHSVSSLESFAEQLEDFELLNKIQMYKHSGIQTPKDTSLLKRNCSHSPKLGQPDITFSTIHKAKGMEWDWVVLLDDFTPPGYNTRPSVSNTSEEEEKEEFNLLYVAITRSKYLLTLNSAALYTLLSAKEKFEKLVPQSSTPDEALKCLDCGAIIPSNSHQPLLTQIAPLYLSLRGDNFPGGYSCTRCAQFSTFIPRHTKRYPKLPNSEPVRDTSRIARRMLINGEKTNVCTSVLGRFVSQQTGFGSAVSSAADSVSVAPAASNIAVARPSTAASNSASTPRKAPAVTAVFASSQSNDRRAASTGENAVHVEAVATTDKDTAEVAKVTSEAEDDNLSDTDFFDWYDEDEEEQVLVDDDAQTAETYFPTPSLGICRTIDSGTGTQLSPSDHQECTRATSNK